MTIWVWWIIMLHNSVINIYIWNKKRDNFAFLYIFINSYRSTFPVIHTTNTCLFSISLPVIERSLSTIAEIAFAYQIVKWLKLRDNFKFCILSNIYIAELYCWFGIITGISKYHVMEESIWCCNALLLFLWINLINKNLVIQKKWLVNTILSIYIIYMCVYDIPKYIYRQDFYKKQIIYCENISSDIELWRPSLLWMTGYFTTGSWVSLLLQ